MIEKIVTRQNQRFDFKTNRKFNFLVIFLLKAALRSGPDSYFSTWTVTCFTLIHYGVCLHFYTLYTYSVYVVSPKFDSHVLYVPTVVYWKIVQWNRMSGVSTYQVQNIWVENAENAPPSSSFLL